MTNIIPGSKPYNALMAEIENGEVKIPQFQRAFVWDIQKSAGLIDSMLKKYPIGTFIFWKTNVRLRTIKDIGGIEFPDWPKNDHAHYVLDGQQRITSIYVVLKGSTVQVSKNKQIDYSKIYIDLGAAEDEQLVVTSIEHNDQKNRYIRIVDLLEGGIKKLNEYPEEYHEKIDAYRLRLISYNFPIIFLENSDINVATQVFERLNVGGKHLTIFEIMVAKTYDVKREFDLSEKYTQLKNELQDVQFDTIPAPTILQVIAVLINEDNGCKTSNILSLKKEDVIDIWDEAVVAIKRCIDYFRSFHRIPNSRILPYPGLIIAFSYYFHKYKDNPVGDVEKMLTDLFWRISLGSRYSASLEARVSQDIKRVDLILTGKKPKYNWAILNDPDSIIRYGEFTTSNSYIKAILCIFAAKRPESFLNNALVILDNKNLNNASSRNYHHFFPKRYMEKHQTQVDKDRVNNVVNITLVDGDINKKIGAKAPSVYMQDFKAKNEKIVETMQSHLINDLEGFGVMNDNYSQFLNERAKSIAQEIASRIIPDEITQDLPRYHEDSDSDIEEE